LRVSAQTGGVISLGVTAPMMPLAGCRPFVLAGIRSKVDETQQRSCAPSMKKQQRKSLFNSKIACRRSSMIHSGSLLISQRNPRLKQAERSRTLMNRIQSDEGVSLKDRPTSIASTCFITAAFLVLEIELHVCRADPRSPPRRLAM